MMRSLRLLARTLVGVARPRAYYLPWLARPDLECVLLLNNIEARFNPGESRGPFPVTIVQYDAEGTALKRYDAVLADCTDTAEIRLDAVPRGYGFVTVNAPGVQSDLYVTVSDGETYAATHGRHEFLERYSRRARALHAVAGAACAALGRSFGVFVRDQYVYVGRDASSHLLLLNLSNVMNRVRVEATTGDGAPLGTALVALSPHGSQLFDVARLGERPAVGIAVRRVRLAGNAWFNLYVVGTGVRDLDGPLSLMHVK
jgi:hypothetical protein